MIAYWLAILCSPQSDSPSLLPSNVIWDRNSRDPFEGVVSTA